MGTCRRMSEAQFWSIYFRLTSSLIGSPHAAEHSDDGGQGLHFADAVPRGKSSQTTPSGMSAWEDVAAPGSHSGSGDRQAAGAPIEGDDLDAYLKVRCTCMSGCLQAGRGAEPSALHIAYNMRPSQFQCVAQDLKQDCGCRACLRHVTPCPSWCL